MADGDSTPPVHGSGPKPVRVLIFAGLRNRVGRSELELVLPSPCTAGQLRAAVAEKYPQLGEHLPVCRLAVDQAFVQDDEPFDTSGELALIPPVSGGSDLPPTLENPQRGRHSLLSPSALEPAAAYAELDDTDLGGITSFIGRVRRQSRGKQVVHLDYEAYPAMALAKMDEIADKQMQRHPGSRVVIHHRVGRLFVNDIAVVIVAGAPHRAEAFDLCRAAIEALKEDVPIWKREVDADGGEWIGQGP